MAPSKRNPPPGAPPPPIPSFLAQRAAKARAMAAAAASTIAAANAAQAAAAAASAHRDLDPDPAPPNPAHQQPAQPLAQPATPPRTQAKNPRSRRQGKNPEHPTALATNPPIPQAAPPGTLHARDGTTGLDDDTVLRVIRRQATCDPELLALVEPHLPRVVSALLAGAQIPGSPGDRDRIRLWRMLGIGWSETPRATASASSPSGSLDMLADRLARAHARARGRTTATVSMSVTTEGAEIGHSRPLTHLSAEQARHQIDAEAELADDSDA